MKTPDTTTDLPFNATGFYRLLADKKLMASRSQGSGISYLPPRPYCPVSRASDMRWEPLSGRGTVTAFTVIKVPPSHMVAAGYGRDRPYACGVVALDEGPSISAQLFGFDVDNPDSIAIGTAVRAVFFERQVNGEPRTLLGFELISDTAPPSR